jgi:SAM-dependent methyltransferase
MPTGTHVLLNTRSLTTAHRRLAELLQPGLTVLDVGCGTGAITRGIGEAVGPDGRVVGIDMNPSLIREARLSHADIPGLSFALGDVYSLPFHAAFDIVTAARVLQWLAHPAQALRRMVVAAKPGGRIVVLDYNHEKIVWKPEPPASMRAFYSAFLRWRAEVGMDNAIADHLPTMFASGGLVDIVVTPQHELTQRTDADFEARLGLWADLAASRGHQMVADGVISEPQRAAAEMDYRQWSREYAESQTLYLVAVEGVRPVRCAR